MDVEVPLTYLFTKTFLPTCSVIEIYTTFEKDKLSTNAYVIYPWPPIDAVVDEVP